MKLNTNQSLAILRFITKTYEFDFLEHYYYELSQLFDGEIKELRIIPKYGMAGKLWNNDGRIYISGFSPNEIGESGYKKQQKELDKVNHVIETIIETWR